MHPGHGSGTLRYSWYTTAHLYGPAARCKPKFTLFNTGQPERSLRANQGLRPAPIRQTPVATHAGGILSLSLIARGGQGHASEQKGHHYNVGEETFWIGVRNNLVHKVHVYSIAGLQFGFTYPNNNRSWK